MLERYPVLFIAFFAVIVFYGCGDDNKGSASKSDSGEVVIEDSGNPAKDSFKRGVQYSLKGDHDKAIVEYKKSLELNPHSAVANSNLGFEYYDKNEYDKSIASQETALDLDPDLANAYYGLAMALEMKGDKDGALENYTEYMKIAEPHSLWWNNAKAIVNDLEGK